MMRVGLVACSAQTLAVAAPARQLYQGNLFKLSAAWMERRRDLDAWAILSAFHGVVMPSDIIAPYNLALGCPTSVGNLVWGQLVRFQLRRLFGDATFIVIAGRPYVAGLEGLRVEDVIRQWWPERCPGIGAIMREVKRDLAR